MGASIPAQDTQTEQPHQSAGLNWAQRLEAPVADSGKQWRFPFHQERHLQSQDISDRSGFWQFQAARDALPPRLVLIRIWGSQNGQKRLEFALC
jgi:hypothetical protein